jgi:hypothetical protein
MRVTVVHCDKCSATIADHQPGVLELTGRGALAGSVERVDLCAKCSNALLDWLRARAAPFSATV